MPEPEMPHRGAARMPEPTEGPSLAFDLDAQIEQLRRESYWQSGRNSKTIVKFADFRIVLMALRKGTHILEHRAQGRISVYTITGHVRVGASGQVVDLPKGHLLALDRCMPHDLEALEDSACLLTLAWPEEEQAR
ncbi:MAG TPA: hypothetical protein VG675_23555 [Bryobacteraceae bacterium]|nr:hypothetical protein [Bryobacteraceae bacterium]